MGMSIPSFSSTNAASVSSTSSWQQRNQDFQSLSKALQSGNLDQAKTAYAQLVKDLPANATQDPNSPLAKIGQELQTGDVAAAQKTMSDMKSHRGGHHRPHPSSTTASAGTTPTKPTPTLGNNVDALA